VGAGCTTVSESTLAMPGSIRIEWANSQLSAFNTGPINLVAPHLQQQVTDIRIALLQGIAPDDFNLVESTTGELVPFVRSPSGYRTFKGLQLGSVYQLKLNPAAFRELSVGSSRQYVPYRYLCADGFVSDIVLLKLSTAFYHRVYGSVLSPASFKAAFVKSAGTVEEAACNQAKWFAKYFGLNGRRSGTSREEGDTTKLVRKEGLLVVALLPKHPGTVMSLAHARIWLIHMKSALSEVFGSAHEHLVPRSILLFTLHFLGFFDFSPKELLSIRSVAFEALDGLDSKI